MSRAAGAQAGFTLVEVLVSVALFGLIGLAGFALLDGMIRVQSRTEGRLERLADLQRVMHVMTLDFEQVLDGSLRQDGVGVSIRRHAASEPDGSASVRYDLIGDQFLRTIVTASRGGRSQQLVTGVAAVQWQFYAEGAGWQDSLPPVRKGKPELPVAIAVNLTLTDKEGGPPGVLRRVIELPRLPLP